MRKQKPISSIVIPIIVVAVAVAVLIIISGNYNANKKADEVAGIKQNINDWQADSLKYNNRISEIDSLLAEKNKWGRDKIRGKEKTELEAARKTNVSNLDIAKRNIQKFKKELKDL